MNSAFLAEIDALEAGSTSHEKPPNFPVVQPAPVTNSPNDGDTTDYENFFDDINPEDLQILDNPSLSAPVVTKLGNPGPPPPLRQRTLFGDTLEDPQSSNPNKSTAHKTRFKKSRYWDFSQPINSKARSKSNSKKKVRYDGEEEEDEENDDRTDAQNFDFSCDIPSSRSPPLFKHKPDLLLAKHWIYPINIPKRDYQRNIVQDSLFENSLVSLPTGLGKTFIAGVIMLNYYRWFPEGKVIFLAPTKPLVAQQIDACHKICGIPGSHSIELTGHTVKSRRPEFWSEKRVFFMTPQTFMNDLQSEACNPTDVVLLVIDEAHRGTGDHTYAQIVRYLMVKNGHFRVLALTATPGSNPEAVQKIIDALHISRIEIRDENSIDLRKYILPKKITTHIIKMNEEIVRVRDLLVKIMNKVAKKVANLGLMPNLDVVKLHPYRCTALQAECRRNARSPPFVYGVLNQLRMLAQAMSYLIEFSLNMCYEHLQGSLEDSQGEVKKTKLAQDPLFQDVITELDRQRSEGFSAHPKVEKLIALALDYFQGEHEHNLETGRDSESKMMIFANYRMVVDEIVSALNIHQPIIKATRFVGQGTDKQGNKGIVQSEQLGIIQRFKDGEFNVLVATSIGEEGLDIGEVDCIICYDAQKTPIRMLQRIGRTGRRRAGRVEVLLSETREEANWDKARRDYESTQKSILRGDTLELYADVERLLPADLKPVYQETEMPIEEYIRETNETGKASGPSRGKKRKAGSAPRYHNVPPGAADGFIPSSELLAETSKKRCKVTSNAEKKDVTKKLPKSRSTAKVKSTGTTKRRKKTVSGTTLSQLEQEMADDSDDKDIELGLDPFLKAKCLAPSSSSSSVECIDSPNPEVAGKTCPSGKENDDHSWLLNSDPVDGETRVSKQYKQAQSSQPRVNFSRSSTSSPKPAKPPAKRQKRQIAIKSSPSQSNDISTNVPKTRDRFLDLEAEVSGECSSDDSVSDVERDSDRRFLEELSPSQRPISYNQTMAYRQSLLTQMHPNSQVPEFRSGVIRQGPFGRSRNLFRNVKKSSSPNRSTDQYSLDSFLVEDDDDIL